MDEKVSARSSSTNDCDSIRKQSKKFSLDSRSKVTLLSSSGSNKTANLTSMNQSISSAKNSDERCSLNNNTAKNICDQNVQVPIIKQQSNRKTLAAVDENANDLISKEQTKCQQESKLANSNNNQQPIIVLDDDDNDNDHNHSDILLHDPSDNGKLSSPSSESAKTSKMMAVVDDSKDKQQSSSNDEECIESKSSNHHHQTSDNKSIIANGRINNMATKLLSENHHSHNIVDSASDTHGESDKTESESDESTSMTNQRCDWEQQQQQSNINQTAKSDNVSTPSRSPKHLLPKKEALTLTCSNVTSTSVRLKWHFSNPNEQQYQQGGTEQQTKRNYIVDMLLTNNHNQSSTNDDATNTMSPTTTSTKMVHQGPNTSYKVTHLQSQQEYTFRVRTSTETCWLVSNCLTIVTPESTPSFNNRHRNRNNSKQLHHHHNHSSTMTCASPSSQQQQQQLVYHQNQLINTHHDQKHHTNKSQLIASASDLLLNPTNVILSADQGYAIILVVVFTIISLIVAVLINHLLANHW
nr:probable serine/threonine-protein kinase DDB_G0288147 [Dermatophagoides farinae]